MGAAKEEDGWRYNIRPVPLQGIQNPWKRPGACIVVTKGGALILIYTDDESPHEIKNELDGISTSNDLVTHASLCPEKGESVLEAIECV